MGESLVLNGEWGKPRATQLCCRTAESLRNWKHQVPLDMGCETKTQTRVEKSFAKAVRNHQRREEQAHFCAGVPPDSRTAVGSGKDQLSARPGLETWGCRENSGVEMDKVTHQDEITRNLQEVKKPRDQKSPWAY